MNKYTNVSRKVANVSLNEQIFFLFFFFDLKLIFDKEIYEYNFP